MGKNVDNVYINSQSIANVVPLFFKKIKCKGCSSSLIYFVAIITLESTVEKYANG